MISMDDLQWKEPCNCYAIPYQPDGPPQDTVRRKILIRKPADRAAGSFT
jgi:hypothetical protein